MPVHGTATATILCVEAAGEGAEAGAGRAAGLADVVLHHSGRVVVTAGAGITATFDAASQGVRAAIALQRRVRDEPGAPPVRIGVAAGDVVWEGEECFGLPVVTAARLREAARPGQIVVSHTVRLLAGGRGGDRYEHLGGLDLPGLREPVDAYVVGWDIPGGGGGTPGPPPLPLALCARTPQPFVGRTEMMAELAQAWLEAGGVRGRIVLVGGEAGAGKTRLAVELARQVHAEGAAVLHGGCDADLALPYQPWVHALDAVLPDLLGPGAGDQLVARLAPLGSLVAHIEPLVAHRRAGPSADPETERHRQYDAFLAALTEVAARWRTLLVLDDLHWAGPQTLALLRHLARTGVPSGLLVVGAFRDTGDEITEPLASCLADLRRIEGTTRLRVGGLDAAAVERFVAEAIGHELDEALRGLAAGLADRSGGNAFFVGELWRLLVASGTVAMEGDRWVVRRASSATDVPDSVREVVADRLTRLSPAARHLVDLAALAGQRIDLQVMALAAAVSPVELEAPVRELAAAGVVTASSTSALAYQFSHAIVRDTVAAAIAPLARQRLQLAVASAIETAYEADRRVVLAELARHYTAAVPLAPLDKAVYYGRRAAGQAMRSGAYDEAIAHLDALLPLLPPSTDRAGVLVELGDAQLRCGRFTASGVTQERAFRAAIEVGAVEIAAQAALGFEDARHFPGAGGGPAVELLQEALVLVGDGSRPLHARLLAGLGRALAHTGRTADGIEIAERATAEARAVGDPESMVVALQSILTTVDEPGRLLAASAELLELAERRSDPWSASYALCNRCRALVALGRIDEAVATLDELRALGERGRFFVFVFMTHALDVMFALAAGDFAAAERAAERASDASDDDTPYRAGVYGMQMFAIRRAQGRLDEVESVVRRIGSGPRPPSLWGPGLAALYCELGMLDDARVVFDELAASGFADVARDAIWPGCLTFLAETCVALGDRDRAAVLYDECAAYKGRNLMVAFTICFGPADRLLGGLAALLGRPEPADAHFADAVSLAERSRSPLWVAEAQYDWATALAARGDHVRARSLRTEALATAERIGIGRLTRHAAWVPAVVPAIVASPDGLSDREVEVLRCVSEGLSNRAIGARLLISPNTVANHVRAILLKTGCANRTEAAAYAVRRHAAT